MRYILLIIEPPVLRDKPNFESQMYTQCVTTISRLSKQNTGCRVLAENVLQIATDNDLDVFEDVVRILPEGTSYGYTILDEEPKWHAKVKTKS
jgi:hypothetical protein